MPFPPVLRSAASAMPSSVRGALWMALAASLLGALNVLVRQVSMEFHPFEIAFFRNLGQLLLMLIWLGFNGLSALRTKRLGM